MRIALLALAAGTFGVGLTEFAILGLLPEVAADLGVSAGRAGWLVSGYALTVAIGAIVTTLVVARIERRAVLVGLLALFVVGNVLCAVGLDYWTVLAGRVVAALCHGAFFGIGTLVAIRLAAPGREARAVAIILTGLTTANVVGVPLGTFVGQQLGWRWTFWGIAAVGVIALVAVAAAVPRQPGSDRAPIAELRGLVRGPVLLVLATTAMTFAAIFFAFTFIASILTEISGFETSSIPWLLVAFGVGQVVGAIAGGRAADASVPRTAQWMLVALAVILVSFAATVGSAPLSALWLVLIGAVGFGAIPALQTLVIGVATEAPALASSANISGINTGIAIGSWTAGLLVSAGSGYGAALWGAVVFAVVASVLVAIALRVAARTSAERVA